ncbi:MAG: CAP domain-containing protein [Tatlockia sp.]|nr:CAP domain-containing protein [Tatlockia sp.]
MGKIKFFLKGILLIALSSPTVNALAENLDIDKANQMAILYHVNEYRSQHHLKPLQLDNKMSEEAAKHSRDMASHTIPFGHLYFDKRINRLYALIKGCQGGSENVAFNYKDGRDVVRNWLTSPGHRRNIEGNFNLTGIGLARDKNGKLYFTQMFIRSADPIYSR